MQHVMCNIIAYLIKARAGDPQGDTLILVNKVKCFSFHGGSEKIFCVIPHLWMNCHNQEMKMHAS